MKASTVKTPSSVPSDKPAKNRATLAAFYIFMATLALSLLYFLSLVFFI